MIGNIDTIIRFLNEDGSWEAVKLAKKQESLELENQFLKAENLALKESLRLMS